MAIYTKLYCNSVGCWLAVAYLSYYSIVHKATREMWLTSYPPSPPLDQFIPCSCYCSSIIIKFIASLSTSEAVAITFVLTMISTLIVGTVSSSLITYCIMKRWASKNLATDHSKGTLYEEVSQPKTSDQTFEMGENIAYGPVRH